MCEDVLCVANSGNTAPATLRQIVFAARAALKY
jgi:hypothetical protein